jgi:hypothetical protein
VLEFFILRVDGLHSRIEADGSLLKEVFESVFEFVVYFDNFCFLHQSDPVVLFAFYEGFDLDANTA